MKLYHDPQSRSVRPLITLEELGVPYEVELISLRAGQQRSPAHLRRHPLGQVPVLEDGALTLFESVAICLYLADRFPQARLAPSPAAPERGLYYQWSVFSVASLELALNAAYLKRQQQQPLPGSPELAAVLTSLAAGLEQRETLLSSGFSVADILIGATLAYLPSLGQPLPAKLEGYVNSLMQRPSFRHGINPGASPLDSG